jgi:hypothetical protein
MARIRSVKPEFWQDEDMGALSRDARLLYIGCWNLADEHSRLRGDARYLKGQLFPYDDDLMPADVERLVVELTTAGKARRYRVGKGTYLFLPTLARHQRLETAKVPSRLPTPDEDEGPPPDGSGGTAAHLESVRRDKSARDADASESHLAVVDAAVRHAAGEAHPQLDPWAADEPDRQTSGAFDTASSQVKAIGGDGADLFARDPDESEPSADSCALLYGACSREHVAGCMEHGSMVLAVGEHTSVTRETPRTPTANPKIPSRSTVQARAIIAAIPRYRRAQPWVRARLAALADTALSAGHGADAIQHAAEQVIAEARYLDHQHIPEFRAALQRLARDLALGDACEHCGLPECDCRAPTVEAPAGDIDPAVLASTYAHLGHHVAEGAAA